MHCSTSGAAQADSLAARQFLEGQTGLDDTTKLIVTGIGAGQVEVEQIARRNAQARAQRIIQIVFQIVAVTGAQLGPLPQIPLGSDRHHLQIILIGIKGRIGVAQVGKTLLRQQIGITINPSTAKAAFLTAMYVVLVPVFVVTLFVDDGDSTAWRIAATVIFAVAALTDRYDGRLARERGLVTEFGKLADPIADKALIGAALISLSVLGELSWWVTGVIVVRELGVTALRFWVLKHGVIPASRGGKLKTLLQSLAIGFYLLPLDGGWHLIAVVLMAAAVVVTVVTACDYLWQAIALRAKGRAGR